MTKSDAEPSLECGVPHLPGSVQIAHGGGGWRMQELLRKLVFPALDQGQLERVQDSAVLDGLVLDSAAPRSAAASNAAASVDGASSAEASVDGSIRGEALRGASRGARLAQALGAALPGRLAITTDSYVVTPREFPGGDIGSLAVFGTVNDLAVVGARPLCLSLGLIIEEGLEFAELARILGSLRRAADLAQVAIVTGDTKVVERGRGHGLFINTTGVGVVAPGVLLGVGEVRAGDALLVSGDLGRHGVAVLSVREGLRFETQIESDAAPLVAPIHALLEANVGLRFLRDLTRGGLASALNELALDGGSSLEIEEARVPVDDAVRGACELLGLDPLYVANEGRFLAVVDAADVERALAILAEFSGCARAARIGSVVGAVGAGARAEVIAVTPFGSRRVLDLQSGEQLPRIC